VKLITKEGFKLPFMGKDKFIELMKSGIGYNRELGVFFISDMDNIDRAKTLLSNLLGEEVEFAQTCFICQTAFNCRDCEYYGICKTRDIPIYCLCKKCYNQADIYKRYVEKNRSILESIK
jgi:hypothetical protein